MSGPMIRLDEVTKIYPGSAVPAVNRLSLDVAEGEIAVLVGPSGCGKTTTLKMINRLIEPTSGAIFVDGLPIMNRDPAELRQGIGYVIQQIGLFPHRTIAGNIATVPRLLGWDPGRIDDRVDELIEMVHLDAGLRNRYPSELSGGQRQRVGVARALAADPPVLLMDEPFGAVDPIVRTALQDQFLALQRTLRKTIVLVTHDIDEAIKLGDRVAILDIGGVLAQYDPPERMLAEPATSFVADFLGSDRGLKRLGLMPIRREALEQGPVVSSGATVEEARAAARVSGVSWFAVADAGRLVGWASLAELDGVATVDEATLGPYHSRIDVSATLKHALDVFVGSRAELVAVFDGSEYIGMLSADRISREMVG